MTKVAGGKFLIDGFPRNADNMAGWEKDMADKVNVLPTIGRQGPKTTPKYLSMKRLT